MPRTSSHTTVNVSKIKAEVRTRDGHRCTKCGLTQEEHTARTGKKLEVHRTVPGSRYTVDGCVTLCRVCHDAEPKRKRGTFDYGSGRPRFVFQLRGKYYEAVYLFISRQRLKPRPADVIRLALEEFLIKEGVWPPGSPS